MLGFFGDFLIPLIGISSFLNGALSLQLIVDLALGTHHGPTVHTLSSVQFLQVGFQFVDNQNAWIARRFREGRYDVALIGVVNRIAFDDARILIGFQERFDESVFDRQHLPAAPIDTLGEVAIFHHRIPSITLSVAASVTLF